MRVFITGIAGFLGSHLADHMLARGDEVIGIDNLIGGELENVPRAARFYRADCNDLAAMRRMMKGCEIVFHCAAVPHQGLSVFSPHIVIQNLVTATSGVMSAAIAEGVRRIVYTSSMARYGRQQAPFSETMLPAPVEPYGIGKACSEQLVHNLSFHHGLEYAICVPHNIIGPRQRYVDPMRNVAAIFINRMLQGKQPYIYGDGSQERCFTFIDDAVAPIAMMGILDAANDQIINIGPDIGVITIFELAEHIAELLGFDLHPHFLPARPGEVKVAHCAADKARIILGYQPRTALTDGLQRMIGWIRQRGPRPFEYHLPIEIETTATPATWMQPLLND